MYEKEKTRLKKQLELQARQLTELEDGTQLVEAITSTCLALLRTAENLLPRDLPLPELQEISAGYLGIAGRTARFYQQQGRPLQAEADRREQEAAGEIQALSDQLSSCREQEKRLKKQEKQKEKALLEAEAALQAQQERTEALKARRIDLETRVNALRTQYEQDRALIQSLTENAGKIRQDQQDLEAQAAWLAPFREAVAEEGFADLQAFSRLLEERAEAGQKALAGYDSLLCRLVGEMEDLRSQVRDRQEPTYGKAHADQNL